MESKKIVDLCNKFWNDYENADCLKRYKMIEKTKAFENIYAILKLKKIPLEMKKQIFIQMLQAYFDDAIETFIK